MNEKKSQPGFALLCDKKGVLLEVLHNSLNLEGLDRGLSLVQFVNLSNRVKMLTFLEQLREKGAVFGWEITFPCSGQEEIISLNGLAEERGLLLLGTCSPDETGLFNELIMINSEQTNTLRNLFKEQIQTSSAQDDATKFLADMARMNNQLVNMQRELARKSIGLERLYDEVKELSITDAITRQHNRMGLFQKGEKEVENAKSHNLALSVILFDIDNFKKVNDAYGHATGDQVLRELADRCVRQLRQKDIFGRYGGEEFALVLPETSLAGGVNLAERICKSAVAPIKTEVGELIITISLGVSTLRAETTSLDDLLRAADRAMYRAKSEGRNRVCAEDEPEN